MARLLVRYRWHILFWVLYYIGWSSLSVFAYHEPLWLGVAVTTAWFLGQTTMIYLAVYRWVPRLLRPGRIWLFVFALLATIFCASVFTSVAMNALLKANMPSYPLPLSTLFWYVFSGNAFWCIMAVGFNIIRDRLRNDRRNQRLEKEHIENELRFLKSQMNPHFLFNAINSIYVLIKKDPALAEHTLASFSDMLRYQLYDCATDYIPIEKEITYLENYIQLEQLRKGSMLHLDYAAEDTVRDFSMAPLLLMPLVENAFKFVSSYTHRANRIRIRLRCDHSQFQLEIGNTVDEVEKSARREGAGGVGMENVRRRLELLYPGRHALEIDTGREYYTVSLKIQVL
ncbi:MAG TPA: histidine kinase [Puia sp.]|jgi:two-component system LytT family sensor kinase|nr:histidine kinase [Puia sp.]